MAFQALPVVGGWYRDLNRQLFEVLALEDEMVEVQYLGGEIDQFPMDKWFGLQAQIVSATEDWLMVDEPQALEDLDWLEDTAYRQREFYGYAEEME